MSEKKTKKAEHFSEETTKDDLFWFANTLKCSDFKYSDVLRTYAYFISEEKIHFKRGKKIDE